MLLKDIAKMTGLSISTVSRSFMDDPRVKLATKERVRKLADKYGYRPNPSARAVRTGENNHIGLIMVNNNQVVIPPELIFYENGLLIHYISVMLEKTNHIISIGLMEQISRELMDKFKIPKIVEELHTSKVIILGHMEEWVAKELERLKIDGVCVNSPGLGIPEVLVDEAYSVECLVNHLVKLGHQNIAFLNHDGPTNKYQDKLYPKGYFRGMKQHGLSPMPEWDSRNDFMSSLTNLFKLPQPPTAIIAYDGFYSGAVIKYLWEIGLKVPDDVSVSCARGMGLNFPEILPLTRTVLPYKELAECVVKKLNLGDVDQVSGTEDCLLTANLFEGLTTTRCKK